MYSSITIFTQKNKSYTDTEKEATNRFKTFVFISPQVVYKIMDVGPEQSLCTACRPSSKCCGAFSIKMTWNNWSVLSLLLLLVLQTVAQKTKCITYKEHKLKY